MWQGILSNPMRWTWVAENHKGIGFALLSAGFKKMRNLGYKRAYCWVLENNPTIKFYEWSGARYSGRKKEDEIGGKKLNELAYEWGSLDPLTARI